MAQRRNRSGSRSGGNRLNLILGGVLVVIVVAIAAVLLLGSRESGDQAATTNPTPTPTHETGLVATPIPTEAATIAPGATETAEPTQVATAPVEPTPTPVVGQFGPLPAAEMPSGSSAGRPLGLAYRLDMSLQLVPSEAPAYQLHPKTWTLDQVTNLADRLGITGDIVDQAAGSFRASGGGSLYVTRDVVQYTAEPTATPVAGPLPTDDTLLELAHDWLVRNNLVGADAGPGAVTDRNEDSGRARVVIKPVEPEPILPAVPSAAVTIAADGTVLQAEVRWPDHLEQSSYGLRSAEDLWNDVTAGRGYVEIDPSKLPEGSSAVQGQATITGADLAYTLAGNPATGQYLVPLVVFSGDAQVEGVDQPIPVKIYVRAISAQVAPRG